MDAKEDQWGKGRLEGHDSLHVPAVKTSIIV